MTQEEKELLLVDLCARLPYGVKIELIWWVMGEGTFIDTTLEPDHIEQLLNDKYGNIEIKPHLRPMSSMTEEESKEYRMFIDYSYNDFTSESFPCVYIDKINDYTDWLNKKMFAYRTIDNKDMFELGLTIEAPKDMYNNIN